MNDTNPNFMKLQIEHLEKQIDRSENRNQIAIDRLIDKDMAIADLQYRLECATLLVQESIDVISEPDISLEIQESYLNRAKGFVAVHLSALADNLKNSESIGDTLRKTIDRIQTEMQNSDNL